LVSHGSSAVGASDLDAVPGADGAELQGLAAGGMHTVLGGLGEPVQGEVAGGDLVPGAGNADLRLDPVVIAHADRSEHATGRGFLQPVGHLAAARLDVGLAWRDS